MNMKFNIYSLIASSSLLACGQAESTNNTTDGNTTSTSSSTVSSTSTMTTSTAAASSHSSSSATSSTPRPLPTSDGETGEASGADETSRPDRPRPPWLDSSDSVATDAPSTDAEPASSDAPAPSGETSAEPSSRGPVGEDPLNAAATCSSDMYWQRGENDRMRPGEACITCHTAENDGPRYAIAGTLFPTGHEPDDCNGISGTASGAKVVITDANGQDHELTPNSVGNFFFDGNLAKPYTAKVVSDAGERLMVTPQQDGDCNKCHTAEGTANAPGRVVVPF